MASLTLVQTSLSRAPGLLVAFAAAGIALALNLFIPAAPTLLVAIILGMVVGNVSMHPSWAPGIHFAAKPVLRAGIVLLGLQLALGEILALGIGKIALACLVVAVGMFTTYWVGRKLGLTENLSVLMASGFSICGAAAVAAAGSTQDANEEEIATALAMVVLYGTLMIPIIPLLGQLFGLNPVDVGVWAGASVHEVAQVVAIGGTLGAAALSVAVVIKLARVLLLAPAMAALGWRQRRQRQATKSETKVKIPPVVPLWVALFLAMVALRSTNILPAVVLTDAKYIQTLLLAAAMFALGTGVKLSLFRRVGGATLWCGAVSTGIVATVGLLGATLT